MTLFNLGHWYARKCRQIVKEVVIMNEVSVIYVCSGGPVIHHHVEMRSVTIRVSLVVKHESRWF